jgi:hypothetical protein
VRTLLRAAECRESMHVILVGSEFQIAALHLKRGSDPVV